MTAKCEVGEDWTKCWRQSCEREKGCIAKLACASAETEFHTHEAPAGEGGGTGMTPTHLLAILEGLDVPNPRWWALQSPENLRALGKAISDQANIRCINEADESNLEEVDAACIRWLRNAALDQGKDGETASRLLEIVKDLLSIYA